VRDALGDLRSRLRARFAERLQDFRLFGSYARGDFGPDSDVDVLVVVAELGRRERREVFDITEEVFFDRLVHISPLALSSAEWQTLRDREYRLASEIARDGMVP
jgi:predicted nucleotidyltransferase